MEDFCILFHFHAPSWADMHDVSICVKSVIREMGPGRINDKGKSLHFPFVVRS